MKRKSKVLGAALLSTVLVMGYSLVALAGSDQSIDSGNQKVGNSYIAYVGQVFENSGTAYTTANGNTATVSVDSTYYYYENVVHIVHFSTDSDSGTNHAQVNFSCAQSCTSSRLESKHNAQSGSLTMATQKTWAYYE